MGKEERKKEEDGKKTEQEGRILQNTKFGFSDIPRGYE